MRPRFGPEIGQMAERVLPLEGVAMARFERFAAQRTDMCKIRCHGDYHLGQVLVAGDEFMIIDFEGEPARPLVERRQKQLAVRNVAGMVRSFHYAACSAAVAAKDKTPTDADAIDRWTRAWYFSTSVSFLRAYRLGSAGAVFVPPASADFEHFLICASWKRRFTR